MEVVSFASTASTNVSVIAILLWGTCIAMTHLVVSFHMNMLVGDVPLLGMIPVWAVHVFMPCHSGRVHHIASTHFRTVQCIFHNYIDLIFHLVRSASQATTSPMSTSIMIPLQGFRLIIKSRDTVNPVLLIALSELVPLIVFTAIIPTPTT